MGCEVALRLVVIGEFFCIPEPDLVVADVGHCCCTRLGSVALRGPEFSQLALTEIVPALQVLELALGARPEEPPGKLVPYRHGERWPIEILQV